MYRSLSRSWLSAIIGAVVILSVVRSATAGLPAILGDKDDVKDIITSFREQMSELIRQAGDETRVTLVRAFQLSETLIGALSSAYDESLHKTFGELDAQQQKAFRDVHALLMDTAVRVNKPVSDITRSINDFNTTINQIANWSGKPLVTTYEPTFIAPSILVENFTITIHGFKLHISDTNPKLVIGDKQITGEGTDNLVSFAVPRSVFGNLKEGTSFSPATLILFEDYSRWFDAFLPARWSSPRLQERRFGLLFTILPESVGSYKLTSSIIYNRKEQKTFVSLPLPTESTTHNGDVHQCYSPENDWRFDVTGNNVKLIIDEFKGWYKGQPDARQNLGGITLWEERKSAEEICIRVMASIGQREDGARTVGHLEVPMVRMVQETKSEESANKPLDWRQDSDEQLRQDAKTQELRITLFDKITYTVIAAEAKRLPFLEIDPDIRHEKVYLRPVRQWLDR
jgi:hypothetical protein